MGLVMKRFIKIFVILMLLLGAGGAALIVGFDANQYRADLEKTASQKWNRQVTLDGPISLMFWPEFGLRLENVSVGNPAWAAQPHFIRAGTIDVRLTLLTLLRRQFDIQKITIQEAELRIETNVDGQKNLDFGTTSTKEIAQPAAQKKSIPIDLAIDQIDFRHVQLEHRINHRNLPPTKQLIRIDDLTIKATKNQPVRIDGQVSVGNQPIMAHLKTADLTTLLVKNEPVPLTFDLAMAAGKLVGAITIERHPESDLSAQGQWQLSGDSLADLGQIIPDGPMLPEGKPYRIGSNFVWSQAQLTLRDLAIDIGDSRVSGGLTIDTAPKKPAIKGQLIAEPLVLSSLKMPEQDKKSMYLDEKGRATGAKPDNHLPFADLNLIDLDLSLDIRRLEGGEGALGSLETKIDIHDGQLTMAPLKIQWGGGTIDGQIRAQSFGQIEVNLKGQSINYGSLLNQLAITRAVQGPLGFDLAVQARGQNGDELLKTLMGRVKLDLGRGQVDTSTIKAAWLNAVRQVLPVSIDGSMMLVHCGYGDIRFDQGMAYVDHFLLDSDQLTLLARGQAALVNGPIDMRVRVRAHELTKADISAPIIVQGTLDAPKVRLDHQAVAKQIAGRLLNQSAANDLAVPSVDPKITQGNACQNALETGIIAPPPQDPVTIEKLPETLSKPLEGLLKRFRQ